MKKKFLYVALFTLTLASCSDQEIIEQPSTPTGGRKFNFRRMSLQVSC